MHRTNRVWTWGAAGLMAVGFAASAAWTQENIPQPPPAAAPAQPVSVNALVVPINSTKRVGMSTKKPIRSATMDKENIARVQAIQDDPNSVLVIGLQAGTSRLRLVDTAGAEEAIDVVVELDIEVVKSVLKRAFPTASVEPIPTGTNTIVLVGTVAHAEEIEAILRVAQGVLATGVPASGQGTGGYAGGGGITVVNALTVGGVRQVQLDVVIAAVGRTELRNFGVNFTVGGTSAFGGSLIGTLTQPGQQVGGAGAGGAGGGGMGIGGLGGLGLANTSSVLLGPQQFLQSLTPGGRTNLVFGIVPAQINGFIQALREEKIAKLLAEPRLVTMSGRRASFNSGGQQALPVVTGGSAAGGVNAVGSELIPFGTRLDFLPIVLGNGKIFLDVQTSVSSLNAANGFINNGIVVQGRDEQTVRTSVMMEPGQTFAIGGLIQNEVQGNTLKTPVLGDLPFIGPLFSTIAYDEKERELVILVTPYLVDPMDCKQAPCKLPGMETRSPDDFELFLELILEAPRGQREVFPNKKYKAAWTNDPTADQFPCGGAQCPTPCLDGRCGKCSRCRGGCTTGACGTTPCGSGSCGSPATPAPAPAPTPAPAPVPAGKVTPAANEAMPDDMPPIQPAIIPPTPGSQ